MRTALGSGMRCEQPFGKSLSSPLFSHSLGLHSEPKLKDAMSSFYLTVCKNKRVATPICFVGGEGICPNLKDDRMRWYQRFMWPRGTLLFWEDERPGEDSIKGYQSFSQLLKLFIESRRAYGARRFCCLLLISVTVKIIN